jgi:cytochrome P450
MEWIGGNRTAEVTQTALSASDELNAILLPQVRLRKLQPGNDIISRLWAEAPEVFADVSEDDIVAICRELFLAGSDTSVHAIANAYYLLLTQPDVMAAVTNDRGTALDNFIEESLRLLTAVQYRFRVANQDVTIGGQLIKKNDLLIPSNAAANRDPEKFECPHMVDMKRSQPRAHLAFNMGPRMCIGAALARAELREAINALIDRLPNIRLSESNPKPNFAHLYIRSYRPLHVKFDRPVN